MLVITCVTTRGEFDVTAVADFGNNYATTLELATEHALVNANGADVNVFNNLYTIVESDGETFSVVVNTVDEFMQELNTGSFEVDFDAEYVRNTIQRFMM